MHELAYPLLAFSGAVLYAYRDSGELHSCRVKAIKDGFFSDMKLVDAFGARRAVVRVHPLSMGVVDRLLNRMIMIDVQLEDDGFVTLDELILLVLETLAKDPEFWESGDIDDLRVRIRQARTHRELISIFLD